MVTVISSECFGFPLIEGDDDGNDGSDSGEDCGDNDRWRMMMAIMVKARDDDEYDPDGWRIRGTVTSLQRANRFDDDFLNCLAQINENDTPPGTSMNLVNSR
jgi:hypothetical protein